MKHIPIILAGGSGTRLWPASRKSYPKQFLKLDGNDDTLFQQTLLRAQQAYASMQSPIIVCLADHRFIVAAQCDEIGIKPMAILLEPQGHNTAPSIALAYAYLEKQDTSNSSLWVFAADHDMEADSNLSKSFANAAKLAQQNHCVVFGIKTYDPETGYGYIHIDKQQALEGGYKVLDFTEKPNLERAQQFCEDNSYFYNSGLFVFPFNFLQQQFEMHAPDVLNAANQAIQKATTDLDFIRIDAESFERSPSISIDYAIMEKATDIMMVPIHSSWSDLGTWKTWAKQYHTQADENNNVFHGDVAAYASCGNYVQANSRTVAMVGINNCAVIETADAILICDKEQTQDVKNIVSILREQNNTSADQTVIVHRPWGNFESLANGDNYQVKRLIISSGEAISLQRHQHRSEHWVIVAGVADIINGDEERRYQPNESVYIPAGQMHQLINKGDEPLIVIEVQTGSYLGEDDIERFNDRYNRNKADS